MSLIDTGKTSANLWIAVHAAVLACKGLPNEGVWAWGVFGPLRNMRGKLVYQA